MHTHTLCMENIMLHGLHVVSEGQRSGTQAFGTLGTENIADCADGLAKALLVTGPVICAGLTIDIVAIV